METPMTLTGIEPATFRLVAQYLHHCATAVPSLALLKGMYNILSFSPYFRPIWNKFEAGDIRYPQKCSVSFMRIGRAKNVTKWIRLLPFLLLLSDLCAVRYKESAQNTVEMLWVTWKSEHGRIRRCCCIVRSNRHIQLHAASRSATCIRFSS